ncbi:MAG: hypothetical protein ACWGQW_18635, partial [bacterium]
MSATNNSLHIAFLANEFVTENPAGGGLGNYLNRITQALKQIGHIPEVFVTSVAKPKVVEFNGVRLERVPPVDNVL